MLSCMNMVVQRSHSYCSPVASPTVDLGRDFEVLIRKCIEEKKNKVYTKFTEEMVARDVKSTSMSFDDSESPGKPVADKADDSIARINECQTAEPTSLTAGKTVDFSKQPMCCTTEHADFPSLSDVYKTSRSEESKCKKATNKSAGKKVPKKKWKALQAELVSFDYSILPRRVPVNSVSEEEIAKELVKFNKLCESDNTIEQSGENSDQLEPRVPSLEENTETAQACHKPTPVTLANVIPENNCNICLQPYEDDIASKQSACFCDNPCVYDLEEKVPKHILLKCEDISDTKQKIHHRKSKKWQSLKARKQVKCRQGRLKRVPHGHGLYVHHRLSHLISSAVKQLSFLPSIRSLKRIDEKAVDYTKGISLKGYVLPAGVRVSPPKPTPAHAVNAFNADGDLPADLVNLLISIQDRDITPEDYDLLLRLDERVKAKTVDSNKLNKFKTDTATEDHIGLMCSVCMENYQLGQNRKFLPCGHVFHTTCIDMWLSNSSLNCPLDGLSVESH